MPKRKPRLTQGGGTQLTLFDTHLRNSQNNVPPPATTTGIKNKSGKSLGTLPRPTAPPFFRRMDKSSQANGKRPRTAESSADDAWKVAEAVMAASAPNASLQQKTTCEDQVVISSDDDFEPDQTPRRKLRRSNKFGLRNDRTSMSRKEAQRSANREQRTSMLFKPQRSVFSSPMRKNKNVPNRFQQEDEEESDYSLDHIVLEAEKSEMSATDDENEANQLEEEEDEKESDYDPDLPQRTSRSNDQRNDVVTPKRTKRPTVSRRTSPEPANPELRTPDEFTLNITVLEPSSDHLNAPKKMRDITRGLARKKIPAAVSANRPTRPPQRRGKLIPRRIAIDSDDSDDDNVKQSQKQSQTPPPLMGASSQEEEMDEIAIHNESIKTQRNNSASEPELDLGNNNEESKSKRLKEKVSLVLDDSEDEPRTPDNDELEIRNRRMGQGRKLQRHFSVTPPSTPSPPSTKKRRRLCKLAVTYSSEDDEKVTNKKASDSEGQEEDETLNTPNIQTRTRKKNTEWYHERDIDTFSSSSADFEIMSSVERISSDASKGRDAKDGIIHGRALPVRRDILKSFSEDLDSPRPKRKISKPKSLNVESDEIQGSTQKSDEVDVPVVDLVQDDSIPLNDLNIQQSKNILSDDIQIQSKDSIQQDTFSDDGKPPPFNLEILCERGESILEMKDRLGEEFVMEKVLAAQQAGRDVIGGDVLGISDSYNREVFSKFKQVVVSASRKSKNSASFTFGADQSQAPRRGRRGGKARESSSRYRGSQGFRGRKPSVRNRR